MNPLMDGPFFWRQCMMRLYSINTNGTKRLDSRIRASWLFSGNGKAMDASTEISEATNEDILMFFFQLDLETRIQYALNTEQYEVARQLRDKLTEVETQLVKQQEAKNGYSRSEAQDKSLHIIRLRANMQKAIDNEKYVDAANLRDEISKLEIESLAVSAKVLAYVNANYAYRLGEKVRHKIFGYRAVVCGMDPVCCESSSWMGIANVDKLSEGPNQPFYQVLVDVNDDPNLLVAYVAQENLNSIDKPDLNRFEHPYASFLFYGVDATGDFIPIKQLREKFNRPRYEVPMDMQNGSEDGNI